MAGSVVRVNDLVDPAVDPARVAAALAALGVPVTDREPPATTSVRAVVSPTGAGTLVTLEARTGLRRGRRATLRRLVATWTRLERDLDEGA